MPRRTASIYAIAVSLMLSPSIAAACGLSTADRNNDVLLAVFNNIDCTRPVAQPTRAPVEHPEVELSQVVERVEIPADATERKDVHTYETDYAVVVDSDAVADAESKNFEKVDVSGTPAPYPTPKPDGETVHEPTDDAADDGSDSGKGGGSDDDYNTDDEYYEDADRDAGDGDYKRG